VNIAIIQFLIASNVVRCFYSTFIWLRHLAYGVIWAITYTWSFCLFLMNWGTLAYAMMTYFSLPTIQFCFLRFTAICEKLLRFKLYAFLQLCCTMPFMLQQTLFVTSCCLTNA
jgi:hypothetical protein